MTCPLCRAVAFSAITAAMIDPYAIQHLSIVTCPACGCQVEEHMPDDHCVVVWPCPGCDRALKPKAGDCCVFCSYGSVPCPPIQAGSKDCCG